IAAIVECCRQRTVVHAELEDEAVDRVRGDAWLNYVSQCIEATCRQLARFAHAFKGLGAVNSDLAGVALRSGGRIDIGDHRVAHPSVSFSPSFRTEGPKVQEAGRAFR